MRPPASNPLELYLDHLRDIYSMDVQLCETMPHLVSLTTNEELRNLLVRHAHQNCNQIAVIAAIFERQGESPGDDKCQAMAGLIKGGTAHLEAVKAPPTRDLMMLAHCLRIEHYEIAASEITTLLAKRLELKSEPETLEELLAEEKEMAATLKELEPHLFEIANSHP